jgi:hypothetical protein
LTFFRVALHSFRDSLTVLHSFNSDCGDLIRRCDNLPLLLLAPPYLSIIPDVPEKSPILDACTAFCGGLSFSLDNLLNRLSGLRDGLAASAPSVSLECASFVSNVLSTGRPDAYWAFYNAQATLLRVPEFCEVLNQIQYDLAVHQVIKMGKALTATEAPPAPTPKKKGNWRNARRS